MGGVNSIPVVSQAKSGVQLICGDTDGAAQTQKDFLQECPGVSQVLKTNFNLFGFAWLTRLLCGFIISGDINSAIIVR